MSHALKRLKATFNDELFLRVDGGYVPTHQADQLALPIIDALASLEKTLSQEIPVKMEESTKIFRVAVSDYSATTVVPKLSLELTKSAPKARLIFVQLEYDQLAFQLRTGKIDAAIAAKTSGDLAILEESLLSERVVAVARNGHPNLKDLSTKTITVPKIQEIDTKILLSCFFDIENNKFKLFKCDEKLIMEVKVELIKRLYKPIYIPLIVLFSCFLILYSKNENNFKNKTNFIFILIFLLLIISEVTMRYSGTSINYTILYLLIPIVIFIIGYFIFCRLVKNV